MKRWAKLLPYCVVMHIAKKFGPEFIKFNGDSARAFRIDKGEWVVWNQENYNRMREDEIRRRKERAEEDLEEQREEYEKLKRKFQEKDTQSEADT